MYPLGVAALAVGLPWQSGYLVFNIAAFSYAKWQLWELSKFCFDRDLFLLDFFLIFFPFSCLVLVSFWILCTLPLSKKNERDIDVKWVNHFMHNVAKMTKRSLKISRCLHHNILKYGHFLTLFMTGFMATLWCFCLSSACILLCIFCSRFGWLWTNFCRSSWRQIPHSSLRPHRVFMQNENRLR